MKTIQELVPSFGVAVCAGAMLLLAANAPAQNLFVASYSGTIYEFTPSGAESVFASGLGLLGDLVFDSAGNLFVSDGSAGTIIKITPDGTQSIFASGLGSPRTLAFNRAGDLFEADRSGNIDEITPQGVESTFASGSGLSNPWGLAFDPAGNLYVACENSTNIVKITPDGTQTVFAYGFDGPLALAFDSASNLYVTTMNIPERLVKISPGGVQTTINTGGGLNWPWGMVIDSSNNVLVANNGGTILKVSAGGFGTFASGLGGPFGIAFQPPFLRLKAAATNGAFQLTAIMSSPSSNIIVQASTDLMSWANIYTNMPPFTYTDSLAAPWRFYRGAVDTNSY